MAYKSISTKILSVLTRKQQTLMLEFLLKKKIKRKNQNIYRSNSDFYGVMGDLKNKKLIDSQKTDQFDKTYFLTFRGFIRANLIALDENNGSRYTNTSNPNIINVLKAWDKWIG